MEESLRDEAVAGATGQPSWSAAPRAAPTEGIVVVAGDGRIAYANAAAETLFLADPGTLAGQLFGHSVIGSDSDSVEIEILEPDRRIGTAEMRVWPVEWEGRAAHLVLLHRVRERRRTKAAPQRSNELLRALVAHSPMAIVATDAEGRITSWNRAATAMLGWSDVDMLGNFLPATSDDPEESLAGIWEQAMRGDAIIGRELAGQRCRSRSDAAFEVWAARMDNANCITGGLVLLLGDVTGRRRIEAHIRRLAGNDAVTGLPNQRQFRKQLKRTIGARGNRRDKPIIVLHLGLDRFKQINKSLGRGGGDLLLQMVAQRLAGGLYETDQLGRTGGDEFSILLRDTHHLHDAARIANRLLQLFAEPFCAEGQELFLTAGIGIAVHPHDGRTAEDLLGAAEEAMDRAKQRGPNNCQFYTADLDSHARTQLKIEHALHRALEREQLFLEFQPQFDLAGGTIAGVEALLRWQHPTLGLISPATFIPVAEASGLILPIGAWVLRRACLQLRDWDEAGLLPLRVAVNVSARQFWDEAFPGEVKAALDESGIAPARLELELTESLLVRNAPEAIETMRQLKSLGIRLSVDDFGTGYSGLSYLVDLPVDTLKIDQSFVKRLDENSSYGAIITAIAQLASDLGLDVIAEGVETERQLEFLRGVRCDQVQGYLLSRPVAPEAVARALASGYAGPAQSDGTWGTGRCSPHHP